MRMESTISTLAQGMSWHCPFGSLSCKIYLCPLGLTTVSRNGTYNAAANEARFRNYTPARRDTTLLHRYATSGVPQTTAGWRAWRIRVTEEDVGAWMMHCHILQHMTMGKLLLASSDINSTFLIQNTGMQTVWVFGNASSILARFPAPPYINGYLNYGGDAYGNDTYDPLAAMIPP